jgi:hypothetical protein
MTIILVIFASHAQYYGHKMTSDSLSTSSGSMLVLMSEYEEAHCCEPNMLSYSAHSSEVVVVVESVTGQISKASEEM